MFYKRANRRLRWTFLKAFLHVIIFIFIFIVFVVIIIFIFIFIVFIAIIIFIFIFIVIIVFFIRIWSTSLLEAILFDSTFELIQPDTFYLEISLESSPDVYCMVLFVIKLLNLHSILSITIDDHFAFNLYQSVKSWLNSKDTWKIL